MAAHQPDQTKLKLEALQREAARRKLLSFIQRFNPQYKAGWVHKDICRRLEQFSRDVAAQKSPRLMLLMPPRHGKALAVGTPVPTPSGWVPIESLREGDWVFGRDGMPTRVVAVSPIWRDRTLFEVSTDDGASVLADAEHEWTVRLCRKRPSYKPKTTRYLAERASPRNPALMTYSAVHYPEVALPVHPYVLGVWLGDGTSQHATITQGSQDFAFVRAEVERCGHPTTDRSTEGTFGVGEMQTALGGLGLLRNKHIPTLYRTASAEQRLALLQGLIDTDGHVAPDGQVEFCSVNEQLARHVLELVRSLGAKASMIHGDATLNGSYVSPKYRVMFYMAGAARLPRKAARCRDSQRTPHRFLTFKPAGQGDTVCIQVEAEDRQFLVGHGYLLTHNSEIASRNFPAWHLGQYPDHELIACSYNVALAMTFSRKVKEIIGDPLYENVFPTRLDPNNQGAEAWALQGAKGGYVAAGIGGPITGRGAHVLLIDDPVKNAEEADSPDIRGKIWEWYLSTAYSRLAPGGGVLIIQTWWHDDDLAGRLQSLMKNSDADEYVDQFEVVKYPAIAEADEWLNEASGELVRVEHNLETLATWRDKHVWQHGDARAARVHDASNDGRAAATARAARLGVDTSSLSFLRAKGGALHPERYDLDKLLRIKAQNRGGRWWSALYQQNPVPDDGGYFERSQFKIGTPPRKHEAYVYSAWDFAISEKKQNDYTVGTVGLQDSDDVLHVVDQVRFRSGDAFFIVESILNLAAKWHNATLSLGFEDGQIYRSIEALLKKRMRERSFYPSIVVLKPITDKLARAKALQGRMQQGMVSFVAAPWHDALKLEMLRFPAGQHDDQVDSLAWMAQMVLGRQAPNKPKAPVQKSWRDRLSGSASSTSYMAA